MSTILRMLATLVPENILDGLTANHISPYFRSNRTLERIGARDRAIIIRRAVAAFIPSNVPVNVPANWLVFKDGSIVIRYMTFSTFLNNHKWSPDSVYQDKIDEIDYEFVYDPSDPSFDLECIAQTIINWITYESDLHLIDKMVNLVNESILCPIHTRKPMPLS